MLEYNKKIYVLGYSGHAYVVIDVALSNNFIIEGYFDDEKARVNPYCLRYFGSEKELAITSIVGGDFVFPAVGDNKIRRRIIEFMLLKKLNQLSLIDTSALISKTVLIGSSTLVSPGVVVNSMATVGIGCIINTRAIVEHECRIADFCHIAPNATLLGRVNIGEGTFVGANSVIKEGVSIGANVVIGAGSVILKNVPSNTIVVGNPGRIMK